MQDTDFKFYERLIDDDQLFLADWETEVRRQGAVLNTFIRRHLGMRPLTVLDCSCGLGTQAIGLALYDYQVHATDTNPAALARARQAAKALGVTLIFETADLRALNAEVAGKFDVVFSGNNALSHFLAEAELLLAVRQMRTKLRRDGLLLISLYDYQQAASEQRWTATPPLVYTQPFPLAAAAAGMANRSAHHQMPRLTT